MAPSQSRRRFLTTIGGLTAFTPTSTQTTTAETRRRPPHDRIWSQHDTGTFPRDPFPDHKHHLGSSLHHVEADPNGTHEFRLAGAFTVEEHGELPPQRVGSIETQTVRLVNQTPETLAVSTSPHQKEVAFAPKLINVEPADWSQPLGQITAVLSLALELLGFSTSVPIIGPASFAYSLIHTYFDADDDSLPPGVYEWSGHTDRSKDRRGGHHVNFGIHEYASHGELLVGSQTLTTNNAWRLTFNDGLEQVEKVEPADLDEDAARTLKPMPPEHIRNKLVDVAQAQGRDPHRYIMDPETPGPRYW